MSANANLLSEALRLEDSGEFELAVEKCRQALELGEGEPGAAHQNLARLLARLGQLDESVSMSQEALRLNPELPMAHGALGTVHYIRGELAQAEQELKEAIRLKPDYEAVSINLGHVYRVLGRHQEALAMYEKAVLFQPRNFDTRMALVQTYLAQAQPVRALSHLNMAARLRPTSPTVYLAYASVIVMGCLGSLVKSGFRGAVVLVGLPAIALVAPVQVSIPVGILVSAFTLLTLLTLLVALLLQKERRFPLVPFLSLILYCASYWLLVWIHSGPTLPTFNWTFSWTLHWP